MRRRVVVILSVLLLAACSSGSSDSSDSSHPDQAATESSRSAGDARAEPPADATVTVDLGETGTIVGTPELDVTVTNPRVTYQQDLEGALPAFPVLTVDVRVDNRSETEAMQPDTAVVCEGAEGPSDVRLSYTEEMIHSIPAGDSAVGQISLFGPAPDGERAGLATCTGPSLTFSVTRDGQRSVAIRLPQAALDELAASIAAQ